MKHSAVFATLAAAAALMTSVAFAQTELPKSKLRKQIDRLDLSIAGDGLFSTTVSGPVASPGAPNYYADPPANTIRTVVQQYGSNTAGALVALRYTRSAYVGFEFNYGYARFTENYNTAPYQIQANAIEYTFGYVVHPNTTLFGFKPYASGGTGTLEFKPTTHGGQGAPKQARQVYYYNVGLEDELIPERLGVRAGFRQQFYLAPDFGQNYLTILKHESTFEPFVGVYFRF